MKLTSSTMEEDHLQSGLSGKTNYGQSISMGPFWYMFTERLLTGDTRATFNQVALDIGIYTIDNFNKVLAKMTKHAFLAYAFCKQKRYLCRHLIKPRSMRLHSFISRLQELNAYWKAKKLHLYLHMKSWKSPTIPCPPCRKTR